MLILNEYEQMTHPGYVYLIKQPHLDDLTYVKVGYTAQHPSKRLTNLQVGNPIELELLHYFTGSLDDESRLHQRLSKASVRGEWFLLPADDLDALLRRLPLS